MMKERMDEGRLQVEPSLFFMCSSLWKKAKIIKADAVLDLKPALEALKTAKFFEFIKQEREIHTRKTSSAIRAAGNSFTSYLSFGKTERLDIKHCQEFWENALFLLLSSSNNFLVINSHPLQLQPRHPPPTHPPSLPCDSFNSSWRRAMMRERRRAERRRGVSPSRR